MCEARNAHVLEKTPQNGIFDEIFIVCVTVFEWNRNLENFNFIFNPVKLDRIKAEVT